ncbi:hypothetical protein EGW08_000767 [Elysia chlorotica]|uniref:Uncharacterized protein n=1 Tax=Elysia chlorotica TaxID=188477 RepID=A0A433UCJ2_ELYCH|nr:hypothetical protein EGW08_000767 [Elysia chlorotica]
MSMLIRRGTIVRKPSTRKSSVRRTRSAGSAYSGGSLHGRHHSEEDAAHRAEVNSVPPSPVAKLHHVYVDPASPSNSPGKASVATTTSTIVSYDECRLTYKTSIERHHYRSSCDRASYSAQPDTALQIEEAHKEADGVCDFVCTASRIVCTSVTAVSGGIARYLHTFSAVDREMAVPLI